MNTQNKFKRLLCLFVKKLIENRKYGKGKRVIGQRKLSRHLNKKDNLKI